MGSPLRGRGLFVLDRNEGLVSPFGSGTLVISWLALTPLSTLHHFTGIMHIVTGGFAVLHEGRVIATLVNLNVNFVEYFCISLQAFV